MNTLKQQIKNILHEYNMHWISHDFEKQARAKGSYEECVQELTNLIKKREREVVREFATWFTLQFQDRPEEVRATHENINEEYVEQYLKEREQEVTDNGGEE